MRLLKLAVEKQRWDLAAHTIILATARTLVGERRTDAGTRKTKPQDKPESRQHGRKLLRKSA